MTIRTSAAAKAPFPTGGRARPAHQAGVRFVAPVALLALAPVLTLTAAGFRPPPVPTAQPRPVAGAPFEPARLVRVALPERPVQAVGWGEVWLEIDIDAGGTPVEITTLRTSPPFTEAVRAAVTRWRFDPARFEESAVRSGVMVAALFRASALYDTPGLGSPPRTVGQATPSVPFPLAFPAPAYPPRALGDAMVVVEVLVAANGRVQRAEIVHSSPGFDDAAIEAAGRWSFRPAMHRETAVASRAYLLFGFRQPVATDRPAAALPAQHPAQP